MSDEILESVQRMLALLSIVLAAWLVGCILVTDPNMRLSIGERIAVGAETSLLILIFPLAIAVVIRACFFLSRYLS